MAEHIQQQATSSAIGQTRPPGHGRGDVGNDYPRPFPVSAILAGLVTVVFFVGTLGFWAAMAPLESAVVSPGIIGVASYRKQVQHLEGGIVEAILVNDGDRVSKGQQLIQLRDVKPAAELRQLEGQYVEAQAVVARLLAERDGLEAIAFPDELLARADDPSTSAVMAGQRGILDSQRTLMHDRQAVLDKKIAQAQEAINGLEGRVEAKRQQRSLILAESKTVEEALKKRLAPASKGLKLKQRLAETKDELIAYETEIGRLEQQILETRLQKSKARAERLAEISEQLRMQRAALFDLTQKMIKARDVLERTRILSPIDGVVVNLQIHSHDGVIEAGQPLLEVVPENDELIVEVFIDPEDIDEVWAGMPADVRLTSLNRRRRVPMEGILSGVSADRLTNPQTGEDYYRARVTLTQDALSSAGVALVAGMGADVFLRTGARSPLDYLLSPITKSLQFGLREN